MIADERRREIYKLIEEEGSASVNKLSGLFNVTETTIRVDLDILEKEGLIIRKHGGAFLKDISQKVSQMTLQHMENIELKKAIALKAAEYVENGETIILDAGSTTTELAKCLIKKENLTIITNAMNIAFILGAETNFGIHVTGGEFKPPTLSLTGEKAAYYFENIYAGKLFLAAGGITEKVGLTYPGMNDIPVKKAMIKSAKQVYLLADSTKIGKHAFLALPDAMKHIDYLITDKPIEKPEKYGLENVTIIVAAV